MPTVTVMIVGKEDPKPGKKRGRIKDTSGMIYQIPPSLLGLVNLGTTYELSYKDETYGEFKYRVVESLTPASRTSPPIAPPAETSHRSSSSFGNEFKDEEIAVNGLMHSVQLQVTDPDTVFRTMRNLALGLRKFKQWQKTGDDERQARPATHAPADPDMDDEIPF